MLAGMRKVTRGWLAGGLLALLAGTLALFGVQDMLKPTHSYAVASGSGVDITTFEYTARLDGAIRENEDRLKRSITKQEAFDAGLSKQVLDELISQKSIDALARKAGFDVPNSMIANAIRSQAIFRNQITGGFDKMQYAKILQLNKLTDRQYTDDLRGRMLRRQMAEAVIGGLRAPTSITATQVEYETERRVISVAAIDPGRLGKPPQPTDKDLLDFYNSNKGAFKTPELRSVTIVKARPESFAARVEVSEDDIKKMYEYRVGSGKASEARTFVQISAPNQAAAAEAARQLAAGGDPQKIAASVKGQAIPFTAVTKDAVPNGSIAEAVFKLQKGQSTGAIQDKLGWAAARVSDITTTGGSGPSYESMREELRAGIAKEQATNLLNDAVSKFDQDTTGGMALEEAAKNAGLDIMQLRRVSAQGVQEVGGPAPVLSDTPELLKAAFQAPVNEPTDFSQTTDGGYALVRVDKIEPPGTRPFDQVKPVLTQAWVSQKIGEGMRKIADAVKASVTSGKSFADAAKANNIKLVAASQMVDRRAAQQSDAPSMIEAVYAAKEGQVVAAPDQSGSVLLLAHVEKILRIDPATQPQLMAQATATVTDGMTNDLLMSLETKAKSASKVKTNDKLLKQAQGIDDTEPGT